MDGELLFELSNPKSFWGTVFSYSYGDNDFYTVEDNEVVLHQCCLECLRLRVNFSIVVEGVSDDKTQDCH